MRVANSRSTLKRLLSVFLVALLFRITVVILFRFDGLYGQDPYAYFGYAIELREAIGHLRPPPPFFWPFGYPLLVVLGTLVTGVQPVAGLAWLTLSAWTMLRYTRSLRSIWLFLSAFTLGISVLTRWGAALAALPWALSAFLAWRTASWPWRRMAVASAFAILVGGLVLDSQFLSSLIQGELTFVGEFQVIGWNPANALKSTVANTDGIFHYGRPIGFFYALPVVHPAFIFPLLTPFLVSGVWSIGYRSRPHIASAQWVAEQVPAEATVITFGLTQTIDYRTELNV